MPELKASLNRIRVVADEMITEIDDHMAEMEKTIEQTKERPSILTDLHAKSGDHQASQVSHKSKSKEETR
jgi:demethoxyubiquinone hydroxylase (CLK1/Coq7/Cat5 family)